MFSMVKSYVPSDYIGLLRQPDVNNMSHWAPIQVLRSLFSMCNFDPFRFSVNAKFSSQLIMNVLLAQTQAVVWSQLPSMIHAVTHHRGSTCLV